jgi:hypothetical protein
MVNQKTCKGCGHEHDCKAIYRKLASLQGTSVVLKASLAFLLPILVFIISLAAFERTLTGIINTIWLQITLGFLFALSVTFVVVLITKVIIKEFCKNR